MTSRLAVYGWIEKHSLDEARSAALLDLAGFRGEPADLAARLARGLAVLAAALAGFGIVLWIAANWNDLGRMGRFALLQAAVAAFVAGAVWRPAWRAPLALLAFLGIGALFAFFGQTYQTGADAWQLFFLWAVLGVPLAAGTRSDIVWAPWALVAMVAVSLWLHVFIGRRWDVRPGDVAAFAIAWAVAAAITAGLSPAFTRWTGAGRWSLRTAGTLAVAMITITGLGALFQREIPGHFALALLVLAGAGALLAWRTAWFDVFLASAIGLGLDTLLVCGWARLLFRDHSGGDPIGRMLLLGMTAAGLLAATVALVTRLARRAAAEGAA